MVYDRIIQGLTVQMRSVEESDAQITYEMRTDPDKAKYVHPVNGTVEDQRMYIKQQREKPDDYLFLFEDLDGKPLGMKGIYNFDHNKNEVETGRFIGYGSQIQNIEALKLGFDFAFDFLKVDRVIMSALENNSMMLSIQKRFGVEFTYRDRYEGLEYDNIHSVLSLDAYQRNKPKIEALIKRFAYR